MNAEMIGRKEECEMLEMCMGKRTAQLVVVTGRRRAGKTFLIDTFFQGNYAFRVSGIQDYTMEESLDVFAEQLGVYSGIPCPTLKNWNEAFMALRRYLNTKRTDEKLVVFFDELPWLAQPSLVFMKAFERFWLNWAEQQRNLVFIACGSVTSWMMNNIYHNTGGLFHRCTCRLNVKPLRLYEVEELLQSEGIFLPRQEIVRGYMVLGGIPQYWELLDKKLSLSQNIDKLFFNEIGVLRDEVQELYGVLSSRSKDYMSVVELLSQKRGGFMQNEIAKKVKLTGSNDLEKILKDLCLSGFVREVFVFGRGIDDPVYQLADFYTSFYYRFVYGRPLIPDFWSLSIHSPSREAWEGLTFEQLCIDHVEQIKHALGIRVATGAYAWSTKGDSSKNIRGAQIDLVLDRDDNMVNLCEIKFYNNIHTITKDMEGTLKRKMETFRVMTGTQKAVQVIMITPHGVKTGANSIVSRQITLDDLFLR